MDTVKGGKAYDALIADHLNSLRLHLRRSLANEQDAQDLTQEAYLRLLHASRSNRVDNPTAYLYQIANRLLWQHYSGRPTITDTSMDIDALPAPQSPLEAQTREELVQQAMRALSPKLPDSDRPALAPRAVRCRDCRTYEPVQGMVKKHLTNGLARFRRRLRRSALADATM